MTAMVVKDKADFIGTTASCQVPLVMPFSDLYPLHRDICVMLTRARVFGVVEKSSSFLKRRCVVFGGHVPRGKVVDGRVRF